MNLVIGASGQVGKKLMTLIEGFHLPVHGTFFKSRAVQTVGSSRILIPLDVRDRQGVHNLIDLIRPTRIFICSSLTGVDYCEDHPEEAKDMNVDGVKNIVDACAGRLIKIIYISTEYVFDGKMGPYGEDDAICPLNVYGRTKLDAEQVILSTPHSLVARTAVVYDWDPDSKNFFMQLYQNVSNGKTMNVVSDQFSNPTLARHLARLLWDLAEQNADGVFNVVGPDFISRYDFALAVAREFGWDEKLISPIATSVLKQRAVRPLRAGLKIDKLRRRIDVSFMGLEKDIKLARNLR